MLFPGSGTPIFEDFASMDVPNKLGASASVYVIILQRTNSRAEVSSLIFSLAHHLIESPIPTTF